MKILIILPRFPYPLEKGDKLRAYHQIRTLSRQNEVYLFVVSHNSVDEAALAEMRRYCRDIRVVRLPLLPAACNVVRNFFSTRSLQIGYWDSKRARKALRAYETEVNPDVVYAQMVRTMKYAAHSPRPKVLDFQDALSMNVERRMEGRRGLAHFFLNFEFKMLRSAEYNACRIFDVLTVISEPDSEAIPRQRDSVVRILRNGVDFDYFHPMDCEKRHDIVFCGNMQYKPNVDASRFLVNEVMPLVWKRFPNAEVVLAGATPKPQVKQLAQKEHVTVTGSVDDIRPYYAQSRLFVAPMRIGSGLQNKLLEAMSMHIPCITTPIANEALGATHGEHLLIGQGAAELADCIVRLLEDEELRNRLVANADNYVHTHFSWDAMGAQLETYLHEAIETHSNDGTNGMEDE